MLANVKVNVNVKVGQCRSLGVNSTSLNLLLMSESVSFSEVSESFLDVSESFLDVSECFF